MLHHRGGGWSGASEANITKGNEAGWRSRRTEQIFTPSATAGFVVKFQPARGRVTQAGDAGG